MGLHRKRIDSKPEANSPAPHSIGILRQVNGEDGFCTRCFLVIEHDGQRYVGALLFDDAMFCGFITKFLQSYIGLPIKDIGDLDISFTVQHRSVLKR